MDTLDMALAYIHRKWLPRKWSGVNVWTHALVLVAKTDGSRSWAVAETDSQDITVTKDFGNPAQIVRIEEIHPYLFLKAAPRFHRAEDMDRYLAIAGLSPEEIEAAHTSDVEARKATIKAACIFRLGEERMRNRAWEKIMAANSRRRRKKRP